MPLPLHIACCFQDNVEHLRQQVATLFQVFSNKDRPCRLHSRPLYSNHHDSYLDSLQNYDWILAPLASPKLQKLFANRLDTLISFESSSDLSCPQTGTDNTAIGNMAAHHLLHNRLPHYAYFGTPCAANTDRQNAFCNTLSQFDYKPFIYDPQASYPPTHEHHALIKQNRLPHLLDWIASLPKPIGLFCMDDIRASWCLEACLDLGLSVPNEVALLGVNDHQSLCNACHVPISSIVLPMTQIANHIVTQIDRILDGQAPEQQKFFPPIDITQRTSSDVLHSSNPLIHDALILMRNDLSLSVGDIVEKLQISRRSFELQFKKSIGHNPGQELRHLRMKRACKLLRETELNHNQVANHCGFASLASFATLFRKTYNETPGDYRQRLRRS